jgi:GNAT superfamily N-acetyltransferase
LSSVLHPVITVANPADREPIVEALVAAFARDPLMGYLFPAEERTYPEYAAVFWGHLFDKRVTMQTVWTVGRGLATAIWQPPAADVGPAEDELDACLPARIVSRVRAYDAAVQEVMPRTPYWYLGVLGTHPEHGGHRWGHAVMRVGLDKAAADGLPALLETSNPANVGMYQAAGWELCRTLRSPIPTWVLRHRGRPGIGKRGA